MLLPLLIIILILCYYLSTKPFKYWKEKGVPYAKPLPLVGNMLGCVLRTISVAEVGQQLYNAFPNHRYVGFYLYLLPSFMIRDIQLIKSLLIQEFDTFSNHRDFVLQDVDPLWCSSLFGLKVSGNWRAMRATISPTFSTGKIRAMFELVQQSSKQFTEFYGQQKSIIELEFKTTMSMGANDIIASIAFGYTANSIKDSNNEFYTHSKDLTNFGGIMAIKMFLSTFSKYLSRILKVKMYNDKATAFFCTVIKSNIKMREQTGLVRPDIIHLLMEARKGRLITNEVMPQDSDTSSFAAVNESVLDHKTPLSAITDEDIVAQALNYLIAGTDTLSTAIAFLAYELALNTDVQNRLRKEIDTASGKCLGNLTYEATFGMKYLDMVVSEGLRKWPPGGQIERVTQAPFLIEPATKTEKPVYLDANTACWIPVYAIHRDPEYYPNPDIFDPERFSDENRSNINRAAYLPFSLGPRNCIASRFALMAIKVVIIEIIGNYELIPIAKTPIPMCLDPASYTTLPKSGIYIGMKSREV